MDGRTRNTEDWMTFACGLINAAEMVMQAAEDQDDPGVCGGGPALRCPSFQA